ncbi:MAG: holo-ACP synthase [Clostridia bacterium]|nr:holo-ACP synthase [Clostridia bacterium]
MIYGVGIDIAEIGRFERLTKKPRFLARVYGPAELAQLSAKQALQSYAANFCAKEAFAKALGTGVRGFKLCEVQVLRDVLGKPYYQLEGEALALVRSINVALSVSITHSKGYAAAVAVAEKLAAALE